MVRYGGALPALDVPALAVHAGELLAVIGPNGAGKSTLLRVLGLLEDPTGGTVCVGGVAVPDGERLHARRRIAAVFQEPLLADLTVAQNVELPLRFRKMSRAERRPRVAHWLGRLGIADLAERRARSLSGGEAQRCALARALAAEPEVLLLDEPFAALDPPARGALIGDLETILRGERTTTVLVTHDHRDARALADRVGVLIDGRIVQLDDSDDVFRRPRSEAVARFVGVETIARGRVESVNGRTAVVTIGRHRIEVATAAVPSELVLVCLRAEDVAVVPDTADPAPGLNRISGIVSRVTPAGRDVRVVVDCGFPVIALAGRRAVEDGGIAAGAAAVATFPPAAAHVIRDEVAHER